MRHRALLPLFLVLSATCLGTAQAEPPAANADSAAETKDANLPRQPLTPEWLFQLLLAEIAGQRGQIGLSMEAYDDLARATRDPRIARRAAEMALHGRKIEAALEAARFWQELEPDAPGPRQLLIGLLVQTNRTDELVSLLASQLATQGPNIGPALLHLNRLLARQQDKAAALRVVDRITEPYLDLAESHFVRAQAAANTGDTERALADIGKALGIRPEWEQAALFRAQLLTGPEALESLRRFVDDYPKAHQVRTAYARMLVRDKRYPEAQREFAEVLAAQPDDGDILYAYGVLSLHLGDVANAEPPLTRLAGMNHAESANARVYLGQIAEETRRPDDAIRWYGEVPPGNEQYIAARLRIAHIHAAQGRIDEGLRQLHEVHADAPADRVRLIMGEAQLLREAGRTPEGYAVLEGGLSAMPDQPELLYEAALMAERIGRNDVLERNLRRLIEIKPGHAHAYNALGYAYAERNERLGEARQLIDKALELAPNDPFILDSKGWVLYRMGNTAEALDLLKKAFSLRPDPEIAAHLGEVLWSLGRRDEAVSTWSEAAKKHPGNATLTATLKKFQP